MTSSKTVQNRAISSTIPIRPQAALRYLLWRAFIHEDPPKCCILHLSAFPLSRDFMCRVPARYQAHTHLGVVHGPSFLLVHYASI